MDAFQLAGMLLPILVGLPHLKEETAEQLNRRIRVLIQELGHPSFASRDAAGKALVAIGGRARGALERAAEANQDPEIRRRAGSLCRRVQPQTFQTADGRRACLALEPGETMQEIAARTLGDPVLWAAIYRCNPTFRPDQPIPGLTIVFLPEK